MVTVVITAATTIALQSSGAMWWIPTSRSQSQAGRTTVSANRLPAPATRTITLSAGDAGLVAALRHQHDDALVQLRLTSQDLVKADLAAEALSRFRSPNGLALASQVHRRRSLLVHNQEVLQHRVNDWLTYLRLTEQYSAAGDELTRVTAALKYLQAVPDSVRPAQTSTVIAGLRQQRDRLEPLLRQVATKITQLTFTESEQTSTPPPLPDLSTMSPSPSTTSADGEGRDA